MTIKTIQQAEATLQPYVPLVSQLTGKDTTLERITPLMMLLGNPQDQLKIVHIAGTSGKTSTAYYMASLLHVSGKKVGLAVSPHVDSVTERVQINGQPLNETEFCELLGEFLDIVQKAEQQPSYFELLYAFALWVFAQKKVDYAVVETGVGGLHDATNVAQAADKVCILTDIGFDHMKLLGNTLPEIAAQKAGIMHAGNHTFTYRQSEEIMQVFARYAYAHQAILHIVESPKVPIESNLPKYQQHNWSLAYACYLYLRKRDELAALKEQELLHTQKTTIPGRMQIKQIGDKTLIMDGAHNQQKMTAFLESFQTQFPDVKPAVLLAFKNDKDYEPVISLIGEFADQIIVTTFNTSQDLPVQSADLQELVKAFDDKGFQAQSIPDQEEALRALLNSSSEICVITGSFYLLSQLRKSTLLG